MEKRWMSRDKWDEVLEEAFGYATRVGDATSQLVNVAVLFGDCLLYTSPSSRDLSTSRMPSSA